MQEATLDKLGTFIRERRLALGLTQTQLGDRVGFTQERVSLLENGKYGLPSLPNLARLAVALEISLLALLGYAGYEEEAAAPEVARSQPSQSVLLYTMRRLLEIDAVNLTTAMREANDLVAQVLAADKIDTFVLDPANQTLVAIGTSNTPMGRHQIEIGMDRLPLANGGGTARAFLSGDLYATGRVDEDPEELVGIVQGLGVRSMICVPIEVAGERRGVLAAASGKQDRFSPDDVAFAQVVTQWLGLIIGRSDAAEKARREADAAVRRQVLDELIAVLSHDLGNLLTPLRGRIDLLRRRAIREDRGRDLNDLEEARHSLARMHGTIERLLDVSRLAQGSIEIARAPVDLVAAIHEAVARLETEAEVVLRLPETLILPADPARLEHVLHSALASAVRYTPPGRPVIVDVERVQRTDGLRAEISVRDEGPPDRSLNMNLLLSRAVLEAHGGGLTIHEEETGRALVLSLPIEVENESE